MALVVADALRVNWRFRVHQEIEGGIDPAFLSEVDWQRPFRNGQRILLLY